MSRQSATSGPAFVFRTSRLPRCSKGLVARNGFFHMAHQRESWRAAADCVHIRRCTTFSMHAKTPAKPMTDGPADSASLNEAHMLLQEDRLAAAQRRGDAKLCADLAIELAWAYGRVGKLDTGLASAERALDVLERSGLRHRLGAAHIAQGALSFYLDRPSQALSALSRAAGYPDLGAVQRAQMYDIAGLAMIYLIDLPTGGNLLLEQAWPHALNSGDPKTIVNMAGRCIGVLHDMACWSVEIPSLYRIGFWAKAPYAKDHYLAQAWQLIAKMESRFDAVGPLDQVTGLVQKALIVSLESGYDAALPIFAKARQLAGSPRPAMIVDINTGRGAAIDGRWETAREHFMRARSREQAQDDAARRVLAWHMSHVEEALGRPAAALREMREFEALEANKLRLHAEWFVDPVNQQRYGVTFDIKAARETLVGRPLPAALSRATHFIEQHLGQPLTLESVALGANAGKRTLQNQFRKHLGFAVSEFIRERRMQQADEELRLGGGRVADVVERIGYSSAANFSRDYRKRFGRSPSATRRMMQEVAQTRDSSTSSTKLGRT